MSLKAFHIVFIVVSVLCTFWFGVFGINEHLTAGNISYLIAGILSILSGILLIVYGVRFLQKLKNVSYL